MNCAYCKKDWVIVVEAVSQVNRKKNSVEMWLYALSIAVYSNNLTEGYPIWNVEQSQDKLHSIFVILVNFYSVIDNKTV